MANNIQVDPIYLDQAANPIVTGRVVNIFKSVEWVNPTAIGDKALLLDADGAVVCSFTCIVAGMGNSKWFGDKGQPFTGPLNLSLLSSGALLIARV